MRIFLLAGMLAIWACQATAHPGLVQKLQECRGLADDTQRLACFDDVADSTTSSSKTTTAKAPPAPTHDAPEKAAEPVANAASAQAAQPEQPVQPTADFGMEQQQRQQLADRLSATVTKVEKNRRGKLTLTLDNEMVWRQTDDGYFRVRADDAVTIERGVLGVFYLGREGVNRRIKVERIK